MTHLKSDECLNFVSEVLTILKATNLYEQVFSLIVDSIVRMYHCQTCAIIIVDPTTEYLKVECSYGLSLTFEKSFRRKLTTGAIGKLLWTDRPLLISDSSSETDIAEQVKLETTFGSCVCVQISVDQRTLGYLHAETKEKGIFQNEDVKPLQSFADFAGIALNKSRLFEENLRLDKVDHETDLDKYPEFLEKLSTSISRAETSNEHLALLLLDIDNYKQIALTYGHDSAKQVLKDVAGVIKSRIRLIDAAGRYGFDEVVILREKSSKEEAVKFAEELRNTIEEKEFTQHRFHSSVSIGIALFPQHAQNEKDLLLCAKETLYEAQRSGRNTVICFSTQVSVPSRKEKM